MNVRIAVLTSCSKHRNDKLEDIWRDIYVKCHGTWVLIVGFDNPNVFTVQEKLYNRQFKLKKL